MVDADTASRGGMIALLPADPHPLVVTHPDGDPADDIHCTLAYLGSDVTGWSAQRAIQVTEAARRATVALDGTVHARVMGHATFNPDGGPDGDRDPCAVHLIGDSPDLAPLRERLLVELRAVLGDDLHPQHQPTIWHTTAGYGLTAADLAYCGPVVFDRVLVRLAGADTVIALDTPTERAPTGPGAPPRLERDHTGHRHDPTHLGILAARAATWETNRTRLRAAVAAYTQTAPAGLIRDAIDPTAPRARRKAQAGLAIATTLHTSGHAQGWIDAQAACRVAAWDTGARAAAHQVTGGDLPIDTDIDDLPETPERAPVATTSEKRRRRRGLVTVALAAAAAALAALLTRRRNRTDTDPPNRDLDRQIDGLAGDLADLYTAARAAAAPDDSDDGGVTDGDVERVLDEAAGVDAYADMAWSQAFLDGATALYSDVGITWVDWVCCLPGCGLCQDVMANGPYPVDQAPGPQHPGCEDWVQPTDPPDPAGGAVAA